MLFKQGRFLGNSASSPHHTSLRCSVCVCTVVPGVLGVGPTWVCVLSLTSTSCVTLGKSLCFSLTTRPIVRTVLIIPAPLSLRQDQVMNTGQVLYKL